MELIKTETVERMNELLEGVVGFVDIAGDSWATNYQHFLLSDVVVVHGISSDFKNHLVLPLSLAKLVLLESDDDAVVERVFESVATVALPGNSITVATTDNGTNIMIKRMKDGGIGRWPCAAAHIMNRVIKNTMKRVNNNSSVDLLPRVLRAV